MFKFLLSIISGVTIGIVATLYVNNWQEEKLLFEISEVAQFGEITYQNIRIKNEGWNPAINVNVDISAKYIASENIKSSPSFELPKNDNRIGGFERIRRDEVVTISLAFKGEPIAPAIVTVKSDRSIATHRNLAEEGGSKIDWAFVLFLMTAASFFIGLVSAIAIPAYKNYVKRANEMQERMNASNNGN